MKPLAIAVLPLLSVLPLASQAANLQSVPVTENGATSAYVSVPAGFNCHVKIPDLPTAFCKGPGNRIYHLSQQFVSSATNPRQLVNALIQETQKQEPNARIVKQYRIQEISQHILQSASNLMFVMGQQVETYAIDAEDSDANEKSVVALAIRNVPNNGAPVSIIDVYGLSVPLSSGQSFSELREEVIRFARSYRYDANYVQTSNLKQQQFLAKQSANQQAFSARQNQIHQNNMNALDSSFNSYMARSAASDASHSSYMNRSAMSDAGHSSYIDSIHERQQLVDPTTGTRYEADGYADYNYVNPYDHTMSVRTNDALYDPNVNYNQGETYNPLMEYTSW